MTGRQLWDKLREYHGIRLISKQYKSKEINDSNLTGFWAQTNSNLGQREKLQNFDNWCIQNKLNVEIFEDKTHLTRFFIRIN